MENLVLRNTPKIADSFVFETCDSTDGFDCYKISAKDKKFKQIFEAKEYVLTNGKKINSTLKTYNKKVGEDISYITGSKTGYIRLAGNCLASTARIDNVNYLLAIQIHHSVYPIY